MAINGKNTRYGHQLDFGKLGFHSHPLPEDDEII
jgi:hypothetical protein